MDRLAELLHKNFDEYKEALSRQSSNVIFEKSYETAIKSEITEYCDFDDILSVDALNSLLEMDNPLEFLYQKYLDSDNANIVNELVSVFKELQT